MKKINKNLKEKNIDRMLSGIFLVTFALGSIFSIELVRYSFWILIAFTFILFFYFNEVWRNWFLGRKAGKRTQLFGFIGILLMTLFFGIQITQLPFKTLFLLGGIVLFLWSLINLRSQST